MKGIEKIYSISYIRVVAMLLIVLYHCYCFTAGVWFFDDSVKHDYGLWFPMSVFTGLNLFVFISGYLYGYMVFSKGKYTQLWPFILNKAKRLLVPYLIWNVLIVLLLPFHPSVKEFVLIVLQKGYIHLWFLLMLFKIFLVISVLKPLWMRTRLWHDVCVVIDLFLVHTTHLPLTGSLPDLAIFYSGIMVTKHRENLPQNIHVALLMLLSVVYVVGFAVDIPILKHVVFILFAFSLLKYLDAIFENQSFEKTHQFVGFLDKHSMGVYILHHIIIFQILMFIPLSHIFLNTRPMIGPLLFFILILTLSLALCWLIEKVRLSGVLFG